MRMAVIGRFCYRENLCAPPNFEVIMDLFADLSGRNGQATIKTINP